jgi:4-hydroxy-tetrahydrodipicolinate synthase
MVTPLASIDALDHAGVDALVEYLIAGGVHALFILGTTGEGPSLSYAIKRELIDRVCRLVGTRIPVLVGITDTAYVESLRLAEHAAHRGAAAVVAAPPYYLPISQSDLLKVVSGWADESALPVYLYNQPQLTKVNFDPKTVKIASEIPNIYGLKDSSGNILYLKEVLALVRAREDFAVLVGQEHLLAEALLSGAHGGVAGGANIFPTVPVMLYQAFLNGDYKEVERIQMLLVELGSPIFRPDEGDSGHLRRMKQSLSMMGICSELLAGPYQKASEKEIDILTGHLAAHGLLKVNAAIE